MRTVGVDNAKTEFDELLDAVEHGEVIHFTKNGATVAKLVPGHGRVVDRIAEVFEKFPVDADWADDLERTVRELRATTTDQEREWPDN
jgi:prevent-host-death family protein